MFLLNSRLGLFSAAHSREHPFSRSYGVNLPSSLTMVSPLVLGFSPHLPVSVCGTGTNFLDRGFSWQCEIGCFVPYGTPHYTPSLTLRICLESLTQCLNMLYHSHAQPILLRHPISNNVHWWYRNINRLSITYAFRPLLRSRLTLSGRTFLRKP